MSEALTLEQLQRGLEISPFQRWLGLQAAAIHDDGIELTLPWREELVSNPGGPTGPVVHGGIHAALVDLAGLYSVLVTGRIATATVDLFVDYHAAAGQGALTIRTWRLRVGSGVATVRSEIRDAGGELVASGRGAYRMARAG